jgi:hypothetical protein
MRLQENATNDGAPAPGAVKENQSGERAQDMPAAYKCQGFALTSGRSISNPNKAIFSMPMVIALTTAS